MATRSMKLPGVARSEPREKDQDAGVAEFLDVEVTESYRIEAPTRGPGQEPVIAEGLDDDAVVEIEYEDGVKEWVSVARLAELKGVEPGGELELDAIVGGDRDRGIKDWVVKGVRIITGKSALPDVARDAVAAVEQKRLPQPAVLRVQPAGQLTGVEKRELAGDDPLLLFIHGTASSTAGSFGALYGGGDEAPTSEWNDLQKVYANRVIALEHHTLSQSPVQNALTVLEAMPPKARLHVVSHSRGGLIGDLLTLDAIPDTAIGKFERRRRRTADDIGLDDAFLTEELEALTELSKALALKDVTVERYVRVAAPARGTRLAGERLDRLLSILTNLVGLIPMGSIAGPLYQFVKALTLEVARLRANPEALPGIEAMMPKSPFVYLLNLPEVSTSDDLAVISGDVEGRGVLGRLAIWATDLFYGVPHDLVVNTDAMAEGVRRKGKPVVFAHKGTEVNHFSYFRGAESRKHLHAWLTAGVGAEVPGAMPLEQTRGSRGLTTPKSRSTAEAVPTVVLVPTALATHLVAGERLWLDADALLERGLEPVAVGKDGVLAESVFGPPYERLVTDLSAEFQVHAYPYDWRQSISKSAAGLRTVLETQLGQTDQPVHVVAHGTGGLLVWAMVVSDEALWKRLRDRGGQVVMLGVPDRGAEGLLQLLNGEGVLHESLEIIAAAPEGDDGEGTSDIAALFRTMPGMAALLPVGRKYREGWLPEEVSADAAALQAAIAAAVERHAADVWRVAGRAPFTPAASMADDGKLHFASSAEGDGLALDISQALGARTYWASAWNGELPSRPEVARAVSDMLAGTTPTTLAQSAPASDVPPDARPPWEVEPLFPTDAELLAAATFAPPPAVARAAAPRHLLSVSVSHGSLEDADGPLLIGHYRGDPIVGAEAFLDWKLDGRLSSRHALGVYPEDIGEHEVVLGPDIGTEEPGRPPGAVVVGLGDVGKLTPGDLTTAVTRAALRYAVEFTEAAPRARPGTWQSAVLSSLLVGSNSGMALTIETSIGAIVKGVVLANRALRELGFWDQVRIDRVEFVELYLDLATRAAHAVAGINRHVRLPLEEGEQVAGREWLAPKEGGLPGRASFEYDTGWWRRLMITDAASDGLPVPGEDGRRRTVDLKFQALTDRARVEETQRSTQTAIVDELVTSAVGGGGDGGLVTGVLFELLLPNTLKEQSNEAANLQLVLDARAAQYPWEMLTDRGDGQQAPLAIQRGVLRQLTTAQFRRRIESPRGRHALVVGDPNLDGHPDYIQLPGALAEAQAVAGVLAGAGYDANAVADDDVAARGAGKIIRKLFDRQREYSIVHIAAHGQYDGAAPHRSGVVIGNQVYLTAAEIDQLRVVPDLVFLNCCHLGKTDDPAFTEHRRTRERERGSDFTRLAASISEQLIKLGVGAVVAAGWAVDDQAAAEFARVFYQHITDGAKLGDAVLFARQAAYERPGNTWGAYQVYGSPDFRLRKEALAAAKTQPAIVAAHEYEESLKDLRTRAQRANDAAHVDALRAELSERARMMRPEWRKGSVFDALGGCFGELRLFKEAIGYYEMALTAWDASAPLEVLDEMLNLMARHAVDEVEDAAGDTETRDKACESCRQAIRRVRGLLDAAPSPERHALAGSIYKRVARISKDGDERREMVDKALKAYEAAHELYARRRELEGGKDRPEAWPRYSWNIAVLRWLLGRTKEARDELTRLRDAATMLRGSRAQEAYWTDLVFVDIKLLEALMDDQLPQRAEELADAYRHIVGGTPKMRSSPVEQFGFIKDVAGVHPTYGEGRRARMREGLTRLQQMLG